MQPKRRIPVRLKTWAAIPTRGEAKHINPMVRGFFLKLQKEFHELTRIRKRTGMHQRGDTLKLMEHMETLWKLDIPEKIKLRELKRRASFIMDQLMIIEKELGKPGRLTEQEFDRQVQRLLKVTRKNAQL
ncbi:MAG: hypothetical protein Q7S92_04350 [Candidatus Diapherotrites archaeon]|nr:hypothetical protein [Candidatus Diapherotrites archaeon]